MTGGTVYIKKAKKCLVGKVRHDGYDFEEFFTEKRLAKFKGDARKLWKSYLKFRLKKWGKPNPEDEIETSFPDGFEFDIDKEKTASELERRGDAALIAAVPDQDAEGYLCGYSDYTAIVDLGKRAGGKLAASWLEDDDLPG